MKDKFAIFLDIDGTIFDGKEIKKEDIDAIKKAREAGHFVFINTGRSYAVIQDEIKKLELDGIIAGLGTHITYKGKTLRGVIIPPELLCDIAEYALSENLTIQFQGETESLFINCDMDPERTITEASDMLGKFRDVRISKFIIKDQFSEKDRAFLSDKFDIYQFKAYGEVAPKGYSKARGIKIIEDYLEIPHENTIAIGDSANDSDMIDYAAIGVAMGNAEASLKLKADYVTASIKEAGVSKAIKKFVLGGGEK